MMLVISPHLFPCALIYIIATLPENYNSNFYINHMRKWPNLALVAEHIPEGYDIQSDYNNNINGKYEDDEARITPLREYIANKRRSGGGGQQQPKKEIVGYILGKVEERPVNPIRQIFPSSRVPPLYDEEDTLLQYLGNNNGGGNNNRNGARSNNNFRQQQQQGYNRRRPRTTETIGHVTSIAVHSHARRLGIASSLLNQLHYHLGQCHNAKSVGLHVRISNGAAVKLYCERLGYDVADIIPFYYGDGEDAYFMRKDFDESTDVATAVSGVENGRGSRGAVVRGDDDGNRQYYERRDDWVNRDARNGGSFFDNRRSMRDTLSPEERSWINSSGSTVSPSRATAAAGRSTIGGHFKRSFQTFLNGGDPSPSSPPPPGNSRSWDKPVWETGPEYLRLPRYTKIQTGQRTEEDAPVEYEQRIAS